MRLGLSKPFKTQNVHFTPNLIPNLTHWYKFNTGLEEADESAPEDGEAVVKWADSKGTNHLESDEDTPTFTEADKSIYFDDGDKDMLMTSDITLDANFAVYMRIKFGTTINANDVLTNKDGVAAQFFRVQNSGAFKAKMGGAALDWTIGATIGTSNYHNIGVERTGTAVRTYLDGTESSTTNVTSSGNMLINRVKGGLNCYVTQLVIVKGASLSTIERANLQTYLNAYSG